MVPPSQGLQRADLRAVAVAHTLRVLEQGLRLLLQSGLPSVGAPLVSGAPDQTDHTHPQGSAASACVPPRLDLGGDW